LLQRLRQGQLTIRGVTQPVVLAVEQSRQIQEAWGHDHRGVGALTSVERKAFNGSFNQVLDTGAWRSAKGSKSCSNSRSSNRCRRTPRPTDTVN
jgi:polyisoprenoid-binding protein YceI